MTPIPPSTSRPRGALALVLLCLCGAPVRAAHVQQPPVRPPAPQGRDDLTRLRMPLLLGGSVVEAVSITTAIPVPYLGIGHALARRPGQAVGYAAGEVGLLAAHRALRARQGVPDFRRNPSFDSDTLSVRSRGLTPAGHAAFRASDLAYHSAYYLRMIDLGTAYRHAYAHSRGTPRPLDESSPLRLTGAPFVPRDMASPWALVPIALAGVTGFTTPRGPRSLGDVDRMTVFGREMSRTAGTALALGYDAVYLLSTAVGEEMFFRGVVQPEVTARANRTWGIAASTAAFSAFHIPNGGWNGAAISGLAGAYLGYRFSRNGYNMREVVAMHFWIDYLPTAIQALRDPRAGRAVYDVRWRR